MGSRINDLAGRSGFSPTIQPMRRNQRLDVFRLLFASLVIVAHAPELTDGNRNREIWNRLTHSGDTFGTLAVDGFFVLSGFLIVHSWQNDPEFFNFIRKRLLRIVPGFLVASCLSVIAVGALAPGVPHFFRHIGLPFVKSLVVLGVPVIPSVLPGMPYPTANGSFWTLSYEFRCYLLVALLGISGLLRRPIVWLFLTLLLIIGSSCPQITSQWHWHLRSNTLVGNIGPDFHLTASFFVGGCFHLFHRQVKFLRGIALGAVTAVVAILCLSPAHLEVSLIVFGSYLLFYLAQLQGDFLKFIRLPDISYGVYLYGFPIESLWIWYRHGSPWVAAAGSIVLAFGMGWLSWHFVERPVLKFKRRGTAALPPK